MLRNEILHVGSASGADKEKTGSSLIGMARHLLGLERNFVEETMFSVGSCDGEPHVLLIL